MTPDFCTYNLACQPWWFGVLLSFAPVLLPMLIVGLAWGISELVGIVPEGDK